MTADVNQVEGPYKGLRPYLETERDARLFFGRDQERQLLMSSLLGSRLTLVYGPSGVGKTSLLRAGVMHELQSYAFENRDDQGRPEFVVVAYASWRDDPIAGLLNAVDRALQEAGLPNSEYEPSTDLHSALKQRVDRQGNELLIILDQFEEYFVYRPDERGADTFAADFPAVVNDLSLHVNFIISLREDSLGRLDRLKSQIVGLFDNQIRIDYLDTDGARSAVEGPLKAYAAFLKTAGAPTEIEPALVDEVLREVQVGKLLLNDSGRAVATTNESQPAMRDRIEAPYLQLVMSRLWEYERDRGSGSLHLETLQRLGNARSIILSNVDTVMGRLNRRQQDIAARAFRYLVTPSGSKMVQRTRDLAEYAGVPESRLQPVLLFLASPDAWILRPVPVPLGSPEEPRYEIFHDVLAEILLDWRKRVEARKARFDTAVRVAAVLGVVVIALLVFAGIRFRNLELEKRELERQDAIVRGTDRAVPYSLAVMRGSSDPVNSVDFSPESNEIVTAGDDGRVRIWKASDGSEVRNLPLGGPLRAVSYSPDGKRVLVGGPGSKVSVIDLGSGKAVYESTAPSERGDVVSVAYSSDGTLIAYLFSDGSGSIDFLEEKRSIPLGRQGARVTAVAFTPDSNGFVVATPGLVSIRRIRPSENAISGRMEIDSVTALQLSRKRDVLAIAGGDNKVRFYRVAPNPGPASMPFDPPSNEFGSYILNAPLTGLDFSPDGELVAIASADGVARLVSLTTFASLREWRHSTPVSSIAFAPDGKRVATATSTVARTWDADIGDEATAKEFSANSDCVDSKKLPCRQTWRFSARVENGLRITYRVDVTGQQGQQNQQSLQSCSVSLLNPAAAKEFLGKDGRPGPYLEGGRGRYYALIDHDGGPGPSSSLECGKAVSGVLLFALPANETSVKLRYPGMPVLRIDLGTNGKPGDFRALSNDDAIGVIPVSSTYCFSAPAGSCSTRWEIGPYGLTADGKYIVFFSFLVTGEAARCNLQIVDPEASVLTARLDGPSESLRSTARGGIFGTRSNFSCGSVQHGWWVFQVPEFKENVTLVTNIMPPVQLPIVAGG